MKNSGKLGKITGLGVIMVMVLFVMPASAHFMWINVGDYTPAPDSTVVMNIGWGHSFGNLVGNVLRDMERLDHIVLLDPKGGKHQVKAQNDIDFETENPVAAEGTCLFVAQKKEGFSSKTPEGYKMQSKKELKDVFQCSYSGGYSKAIVNVGNSAGDTILKPLGHTLEIVPLQNPANLTPGDFMPLKVLYNGKPLRVEIYATYAGFSPDGAWAYTTMTDKEGMCRIKMLHSGVWLVKVGHKLAYPDPKECDQYSYTSTLTFEVK